MNARILNREGSLPADNWYQVEVVGQHYNPGADVVQIIDERAVERIVNRFAEEAKAPNFAGLRIGRDHLADDLSQPTEALGWLMELRNREGVPEGRIEWTAVGRPLIESKPGQPPVYKFFTTEYDPPDLEPAGAVQIRNRSVRAVRPIRLSGLDVTNKPNNRGGKPISNRDPGAPPEAGKTHNTEATMQKIIAVLGLPAEATEDQIVEAIKSLQAKGAEMPALKNRLQTAETELTTLRDAQMEADLDARAAKIRNREATERMYRADREGTLALIDGIEAPAEAPGRITNRATARTPAEIQAEKDDTEVAAKIRNRCGDLQAKGMSFRAAHEQATREVRGA